ncbi:MAG TPA: hypothetical protein VIF34_03435 [Methylocystis sp.]|jgi:hypothetical protein
MDSNEFVDFCVAFDVALYRDRPKSKKDDAEKRLEDAIDYALQWHDRASLLALKIYLDKILTESDPKSALQELWKNTRPRVAFFEGAGPSGPQTGIVHVFTQVRDAVAKRLAAK